MLTTDAVVRALLAAINEHDLDTIVSLYAEDITNHGRRAGREGMRAVHAAIFAAFPDWGVEADDIITTADRAVVRGHLTGTHLGEPPAPFRPALFGGALDGVRPTGRAVRVPAIHIWEIADGLATAHWAVRDDVALRRQLTSSTAEGPGSGHSTSRSRSRPSDQPV